MAGDADPNADLSAETPREDGDAAPEMQDAALTGDTAGAQAASVSPEPAPAEGGADTNSTEPDTAARDDTAPDADSGSDANAQAEPGAGPEIRPEGDSGPDAMASAVNATPDATDGERTQGALPPPAAAPPPPPPPPPAAKGGFFPMLLGGLVAGGIGYGAHFYLSAEDNGTEAAIAALQSDLAELRSALADAPEASEVARLEAELTELRAELASSVEMVEGLDIAGDIEAGMDRLRAEFASSEDVSPDTQLVAQISGLRRDLAERTERLDGVDATLEGLDNRLSAQADDFAAVTEDMAVGLSALEDSMTVELAALAEELAQVRELAEHRIEEAEAAVDTALAGAGLEAMRTALERGTAYPEAVALLREAGVEVPDALAGPAAQGIPTLEMLQDSFAPAARAGLRAALQEAPADSTTERLGNFLRAQVGARSTAPREGDDPDAVMSRAAAALEAGDLEATLSELDALPDAALPGLQDWMTAAQARQDAEAAMIDFATIVTNQ